jgi:hypothetical protein
MLQVVFNLIFSSIGRVLLTLEIDLRMLLHAVLFEDQRMYVDGEEALQLFFSNLKGARDNQFLINSALPRFPCFVLPGA